MRLEYFAIARVAIAVTLAATTHAQTKTFPYDHIHLNVPDPAAPADWYEKHFGGGSSRPPA